MLTECQRCTQEKSGRQEFADRDPKLEGRDKAIPPSDKNVSLDKNIKKQHKLREIAILVFLEFQHKMEGSPLWGDITKGFSCLSFFFFFFFKRKSIPYWLATSN